MTVEFTKKEGIQQNSLGEWDTKNGAFKDLQIGEHPEEVTNPYSGESCILQPHAVAVYDLVKGSEQIGDYETMNIGLDWFKQYYPSEYMTLLD